MRNLVFTAAALMALALVLAGCGSGGSSSPPPDDGTSSGGSSSGGIPGTGPATLSVRSVPSGAAITLDGRATGQITPADLTFNDAGLASEHVLQLSLGGQNTWGGIATVTGGQTLVLQATLTPVTAQPGTVTAHSDPAGARVYLDGADTGRSAPSVLNSVPAGQHVLEFRSSGFYPYREQVTLRPSGSAISAPVLTRVGNGRITGRVLSPEGDGLVGAQVSVSGTSAVAQSTMYGLFVLPNVSAGQGKTVTAAITTGGVVLSGAHDSVNVDAGRLVSNLDITTSVNGATGALIGRVTDSTGAVEGAMVFASMAVAPSFAPDPNTAPRQAETDADGSFRIASLPPGFWVVTALYRDMAAVTHGINPQIWVGPDDEKQVDFRLSGSTGDTPGTPIDLTATAFTMPAGVSRAAGSYDGIRERLLAVTRSGKWGAKAPRRSAALRERRSRTAPDGSLIEVDLSWTGRGDSDLIGYYIGRSEQQGFGFALLDELLAPYAGFWIDYDMRFTPGHNYYYRVTAVTSRERISSPSNTATAHPLEQLVAVGPAGTIGAATPTFSWESLPEAFLYGVQVFRGFPDRLADPLWESDSLFSPHTSVAYSGPALQSGHTYYWVVAAGNSTDPNKITGWSLSRITSFTVR